MNGHLTVGIERLRVLQKEREKKTIKSECLISEKEALTSNDTRRYVCMCVYIGRRRKRKLNKCLARNDMSQEHRSAPASLFL